MNIFEELQHRLSSKTRIRALFKDINPDDMKKIIRRIDAIYEEKKQLNQQKEKELQSKQQSLDEIKALLSEKGLSLSDLGKISETSKRKRRNISKFVFEYQNSTGSSVTWIGSTTGRLPKDFQIYLEKTGKKRLDCVVEDALS